MSTDIVEELIDIEFTEFYQNEELLQELREWQEAAEQAEKAINLIDLQMEDIQLPSPVPYW